MLQIHNFQSLYSKWKFVYYRFLMKFFFYSFITNWSILPLWSWNILSFLLLLQLECRNLINNSDPLFLKSCKLRFMLCWKLFLSSFIFSKIKTKFVHQNQDLTLSKKRFTAIPVTICMCMCVCVCVCLHIFMCVYFFVNIYIYIFIYLYIYIYIYIYLYMSYVCKYQVLHMCMMWHKVSYLSRV